MIATAEKPCVTPQEYLERERRAETKSEYIEGRVVPMAGASWEHNLITSNTARRLGNQLDAGNCVVISADLRVRVPQCDKYYYPDVIVVCGEPRFEDTHFDTLLNPTVLIEVLSDSTEHHDRGEKMDCYATLESLTDYVLIAQEEPRIEHFSRLTDGGWHYVAARGLDAMLALPAVGCTLRLAEVYARIVFPPKPTITDNNAVK